MVLVWQYGEKSGFESWKGLAWGMVGYNLYRFFFNKLLPIGVINGAIVEQRSITYLHNLSLMYFLANQISVGHKVINVPELFRQQCPN